MAKHAAQPENKNPEGEDTMCNCELIGGLHDPKWHSAANPDYRPRQ